MDLLAKKKMCSFSLKHTCRQVLFASRQQNICLSLAAASQFLHQAPLLYERSHDSRCTSRARYERATIRIVVVDDHVEALEAMGVGNSSWLPCFEITFGGNSSLCTTISLSMVCAHNIVPIPHLYALKNFAVWCALRDYGFRSLPTHKVQRRQGREFMTIFKP